MTMDNTISIPINSELIGELYLRAGPQANIAGWIETVLSDYLDRTAEDSNWSEEFYNYRKRQLSQENFIKEFGPPAEGYHWTVLFLPNGTSICMEYKREKFYAKVKFGKIDFNGKTFSPSELACHIANGTSRNAWRDLLIKRPGEHDWTLADDLRRHMIKIWKQSG
jgi:hypothetical protein